MNLGIGSLRTGIFNVADVYIMVGAALWLLGERPNLDARAPG
jgi:lipoprotein signal peptidase